MYAGDRQLIPSRTVIVHGFADNLEYDEFKATMLPEEKVFETYTIPKTNFLFIMFYDLRDSMKFKNSFSSDHLYIQYTISKYEIPRKTDECVAENLQSTVSFQFKDIEINIEDTFIVNFLKQYGEIKELKISKPQQKTVEFYDFRSAKKAYETLNESSFGTGVVKCKWMWDISTQMRTEYLSQTDDLLKKLSAPVPVHSQEMDEPSKRAKLEQSESKNPFINIFDNFIAENISAVEKVLRLK